MHEMSLVSAMMNIVDEYSRRHGFSKVRSLTLSFGALSGIDGKALQFAFEVISQGTRAHGASLVMDIQPIVCRCISCGKESRMDEFPAPCPHCASADVILAAGVEELRLVEMDVD